MFLYLLLSIRRTSCYIYLFFNFLTFIHLFVLQYIWGNKYTIHFLHDRFSLRTIFLSSHIILFILLFILLFVLFVLPAYFFLVSVNALIHMLIGLLPHLFYCFHSVIFFLSSFIDIRFLFLYPFLVLIHYFVFY